MNEVRRKIGAAQRKVNDEKSKLSSAIRRLQVDNSSRRIRMSSNELSIHLRKAAQIENKLNKMALDIDYTVRRFREVDKKCASRIKSVGLNYRKSAGLLTKSESLFRAGESFLTGDFGSLINQGKEAFGKIKGDVVNWYHKNEAIINNIATIALEGLAAIGTVAAIAAGALTGVGLVIAVAGLIYGASNMIDSGVKLYNYTTTGEEKGFNFIQEGMKAALGNDLGNKVFEISNIALAIANVAQLGAGAYRLLKEKEVLTGLYDIAKNAKTYGKAFTEALTDLSKGSVVLGMNGGGKQLENIIEASKRAKGVLDAEKEAATAIRTGENIVDGIDAVDDIARSGVEGVSEASLTAKDIPTAKSGEFNDFFNSLTSDELDELWEDKSIRKKIERELRAPGGLHEWHLVSRAPQFKHWGISAEQITDLRSVISDVKFKNPSGMHGGLGSTAAHNELLSIIDSSQDYNTFIRRLNNWANYRLEGGINSLPEGLRLR